MLLALVALVPSLASAGPLTDGCRGAAGATVCTYEFRYTEGCFDWGSTTVYASAGSAGGYVGGYAANDCDVTSQRGVFLGAYGPGLYERASWRSTASAAGSTCDTTVEGAAGAHDLDCPAGSPPNPGWGQLLP